ncbi:MAG: hypothetical protein QNJ64_16940 [Crocosphaera sp.]|nr:hypothetical protein [Crocosphaera sp.]
MNTFSLEEEQTENSYSRKVDFSFSNEAIDKVASVFNDYIPLKSNHSSKSVQPAQKLNLPLFETSTENSNTDTVKKEDGEVVETTTNNISDNELVSEYFEEDEQGVLISKQPDYKGKNKKAQQERFILLYVWAYNTYYQKPVPHTKHLNKAARTNNIYSNNISTYIKDISQRYCINSDGTFKLNPNGHKQAQKIRLEIQDSGLKGVEYWSSTKKHSRKSSRITEEEGEKINQWVDMESKLENFDIRKLTNKGHIAIFALYDLTKELKVENAAKPALAYQYLKKRHETVSISQKSFSDALCSKGNKKYFQKTPEGLYYLTEEAEKIAQNWISET